MRAENYVTFSDDAIRSLVKKVLSGMLQAHVKRQVTVKQSGPFVDLDIPIFVTFGTSIPDVVKMIRWNVKEEIESSTHLTVRSISINVMGIQFINGPHGGKMK